LTGVKVPIISIFKYFIELCKVCIGTSKSYLIVHFVCLEHGKMGPRRSSLKTSSLTQKFEISKYDGRSAEGLADYSVGSVCELTRRFPCPCSHSAWRKWRWLAGLGSHPFLVLVGTLLLVPILHVPPVHCQELSGGPRITQTSSRPGSHFSTKNTFLNLTHDTSQAQAGTRGQLHSNASKHPLQGKLLLFNIAFMLSQYERSKWILFNCH